MGKSIVSKTGHAFMKQSMRLNDAIYGGEISAHHYFRDFAFCDSGMLPCFLLIGFLSQENMALSDLIEEKFRTFPSSGEVNFNVSDPPKTISEIIEKYRDGAVIDKLDGVSFTFKDWRFNIRSSNTEALVRLNVEAKGSVDIVKKKVEEITREIMKKN